MFSEGCFTMFTFGRYGCRHTDFLMALAPYTLERNKHTFDHCDHPGIMTFLQWRGHNFFCFSSFLLLSSWNDVSTRVGSQITVANHVSRPISPSPSLPQQGDTQIIEGIFGTFLTIKPTTPSLIFWHSQLLIHIDNILTIFRSYW